MDKKESRQMDLYKKLVMESAQDFIDSTTSEEESEESSDGDTPSKEVVTHHKGKHKSSKVKGKGKEVEKKKSKSSKAVSTKRVVEKDPVKMNAKQIRRLEQQYVLLLQQFNTLQYRCTQLESKQSEQSTPPFDSGQTTYGNNFVPPPQ